MVAGGLLAGWDGRCAAIVELPLAMRDLTEREYSVNEQALQLKICVATGPVVAGVVGTKKFIYDLWGDTVSIAGRLTSESEPGRIQVDEVATFSFPDTLNSRRRARSI